MEIVPIVDCRGVAGELVFLGKNTVAPEISANNRWLYTKALFEKATQ
jgi:hypothetical protein